MSDNLEWVSWRGYLGDGAYVKSGRFGGEVVLCVSDGIEDSREIYLEQGAARRLQAILAGWTNNFQPPPPGAEGVEHE